MRKLIEHLQAIALHHGASLKCPSTLMVMSIEWNNSRGKHRRKFSRGVLATVADALHKAGYQWVRRSTNELLEAA